MVDGVGGSEESGQPRLSVVVLSYNRREALSRTLSRLHRLHERGDEVVVVDNASSDGSAGMVAESFSWCDLVELQENVGVEGFNVGASRARGRYVLILDDDAWPEPAHLDAALDMLDGRPDLGAVALHRRHPETGGYEWPFRRVREAREGWPDMGCGNLVRREAWLQVGGYEAGYFLYRNDTDLALKLLGAGWGVRFDPGWLVWHDSPFVKRKSERWLRLSTRNWVWMCRRHGRGGSKVGGVLLGWAWAHRLAGAGLKRQWLVVRGAAEGLVRRPPTLESAVRPDGRALGELLRLKRRLRDGGGDEGAVPEGRVGADQSAEASEPAEPSEPPEPPAPLVPSTRTSEASVSRHSA